MQLRCGMWMSAVSLRYEIKSHAAERETYLYWALPPGQNELGLHSAQGPPLFPTKPGLHTQSAAASEPAIEPEFAGHDMFCVPPGQYLLIAHSVQLVPLFPTKPGLHTQAVAAEAVGVVIVREFKGHELRVLLPPGHHMLDPHAVQFCPLSP